MTSWVCNECGCDVAEYGVCRCFDDEMEFFCAECAKEHHDVELKVKKQVVDYEAVEKAINKLLNKGKEQ